MKKSIITFFSLITLFSLPVSSLAETNPIENNESVVNESIEGRELLASYSDQDVTAYVAPAGKKTYHETVPRQYTTAAVHPVSCGNVYSGTRFVRGTIISTSKSFGMPNGTAKNTFVVEDMGDVNCDRGLSYNWFDIYFGDSSNYNNAVKFGRQQTNYSTY
ncbi:hypothetical protein [Bacillus pseudomycoides]|uniref:hypothetical protein n=1 Tax=Bacillus pseudomycoides TaxID=64104 RepID=UPI000BECDB59|nr:hypothetical protein [Bacillus pseudomycoides]PEE42555.1 hypothetical protein COO02_06870 [Bacillus pseudomycoides]PGA84072.1 hypothetical protein COL91_25955 [Bacillus pseudomycoides]PHF45771.1 hypothetical protein COF72_13590 [Bacillus pseudomycoides]